MESADGKYRAHEDVAVFSRDEVNPDEELQEMEVIEQPEWVQTMEDNKKHYGKDARYFLKNVVYKNFEGDVVIAITFAPYSQETIDLAAYAHGIGNKVVAISDAPSGPLRKTGALMLSVSEVDVGAFRALSATISLAIALAVSVGAKRDKLADGK